MSPPDWLTELYRQWFSSRGNKLGSWSRPYHRKWDELLDAAGIIKVDDINTAAREARKLKTDGKLALKCNDYRPYLIERVIVPFNSEKWLRQLFSSQSPDEILNQSLEHVRRASALQHPLFPDSWSDWLKRIEDAFVSGGRIRPLSWRHPVLFGRLLRITFQISAKSWPPDTLVREASVDLGLATKDLERSQRLIEACLASMLGRVATFEMLGIAGSQPRIEIAGQLLLQFANERTQLINELRSSYHLTSDLMIALKAETPAKRVLTVENTKTTLRRIASLNLAKDTLVVACAYPTRGLIRLFELLPADIPVFHFGDTDPAGFLILSKLRQAIKRPVTPFLMARRERNPPTPLTDFDRSVLPNLLADPFLKDVRPHLEAFVTSNDKGDFEQESLGRPRLSLWPFFEFHPDAAR